MTVQDLMDFLESCDPEAEVRIAFQPSYPLEYEVEDVAEVRYSDEDAVYIASGNQLGYLSSKARAELRWNQI